MSGSNSYARNPGFASFLPAIALALISAVALATAQMRPSDKAGDQVAVIFGPGTSLAEAIARTGRAEGTVVRVGAFSNIVVAVGSAPDFIDRVREKGAWLVVDPRGLGGCFIESGTIKTVEKS